MSRTAAILLTLSLSPVAFGWMNIAPPWKKIEFEASGGYFVSVEVGENDQIEVLRIRGRGTDFEIPPADYRGIKKPLLSGIELYRSGEKYWTVEVPFLPDGESMAHCAWKFQFEGTDYVGVVRTRRSTIEAFQLDIDCGSRSD